MRTINTHAIEGLNEAITLTADDRDPKGNMSHRYVASFMATYTEMLAGDPLSEGEKTEVLVNLEIDFQDGPVKEKGVNGLSNEVLLAIVIDRLEGAQEGPYACQENHVALDFTRSALNALHLRTRDRLDRAVESSYQK